MNKEIKVTSLYLDYVYGAKYDAVVEIGGRYSSKSYNSQIEEAANLASKKDYKLLIIQELDKGASDGYYAGLVDKIKQFEQLPAYNITESSTKITNTINGNQVLFRGYKTDQQKKDVKNIDQVTKIVVEEGEWMTFDDFLALIQQLRGKVEEDRRLDILMNPVNEYCFANTELVQAKPDKVLLYFEGTNRPKVFEKHFKMDSVDDDGNPKVLSIKVLVVLSTHHDNKYLSDIQRAAIEIYRTTDPDKYKQLGEARFIKSGGVYFKEFQRDIHVIEPIEIQSHWHRYTTKDYGLDMLANYWIAVDPYNNAYVYKELCEPDLIVSAAAKRIKEVNGNDKIVSKYYPPDLDAREKRTGKKISDLFRENGEVGRVASSKRVAGWLAMKEWLKVIDVKNLETGELYKTSKMKIFDNCTELIKCLSQAKKSENDPNDVATEPHEFTHSLDAIRYFCIMRQLPPDQLKENQIDEFRQQQDKGRNYLGGEVDSSYL